jgi:4-diphosphocytidyl-2-C-methyl-D-erythritol kinase
MYTIRQGTRIRIDTPAKLNLFLELRRRRSDDYHELETLMVPISVYDSLIIQPRDDDRLNLQCCWAPGLDPNFFSRLPDSDDNLAYKAIDALRRRVGVNLGADIWLRKRIPARAGLGGASTDAAAALVAGNVIWQLGQSRQQLAEIAAELGSDVPFFLYGSAALCRGRGELVEPLPLRCPLSFVLIKPRVGLSTADVYQHAKVPDQPAQSDSLRSALQDANLANVGRRLFNRLQSAAASLSPWIERMASTVESCGVYGHQMSGSGTSYFALCRHGRHARQIAARLRAVRLGNVLAVSTLGPVPA